MGSGLEVANVYPYTMKKPCMMPEGRRRDRHHQPGAVRLGRQPAAGHPGVVWRYRLQLPQHAAADCGRAAHGGGGHSLVDHRHRRLRLWQPRRPGLPGAAGALVPVRGVLPVFRLHGARVFSSDAQEGMGYGGAPSGAPNEVWSYGEEAYGILCKYLFLRERIRGYVMARWTCATRKASRPCGPCSWTIPRMKPPGA